MPCSCANHCVRSLRISDVQDLTHDHRVNEYMHAGGGTIVCSGVGCLVTFTNVTFHACTVVALNGAQVTLQSPKFTSMAASQAGLGIFAHGEGTSVHVQDGCIHSGMQAVTVQAGARFEATRLKVSGIDAAGFEVKDKASCIKLWYCTVEDVSTRFRDMYAPRGVLASSGGDASMHGCEMSGCFNGAQCREDGSRLAAKGCTFKRSITCGVLSTKHASAIVEACCSVDNGTLGFCAQDDAKMTINGSTATGSASSGIAVMRGGSAVLTECSVTKSKMHGVYVGGVGSQLEADGCILEENTQCGALSDNEAEGIMRCCRSASNGADGYCVQAKAALTVKNSSATASMNHGFGVMTGGKLVLKECQAGGSNGHGLHAINEGSVLEGETCTCLLYTSPSPRD